MVSIHGGLNSVAQNVKRVAEHYGDAVNDQYYPIFVNWRSGAMTTLRDRYFGVRNGVDSSLWVTVPSSPLYLLSDLLRGIAAIPESLWDQGSNLINTHRKRITDADEADIKTRKADFSDVNFYYTGRGKEKTVWGQVGYGIRQVVPGALRIVSTPLIEGVANQSWEVMLRRVKTLMYRQSDFTYHGSGKYQLNANTTILACERLPYFIKNGPNGMVAQLMRALGTLGKEIEITLVGHSMGAIIANDIVEQFNYLHYDKIIHMASADSIRNLIAKTLPYLDLYKDRATGATQFYNLMLHPTNEEQEQTAYGVAPEGSLLMWLDYLLVNPETSLDRRAGRWDNIKWALNFFKDQPYMHFKLFGLRYKQGVSNGVCHKKDEKKPTCDEPIVHGDFSDYKFWREDFYWGGPQVNN